MRITYTILITLFSMLLAGRAEASNPPSQASTGYQPLDVVPRAPDSTSTFTRDLVKACTDPQSVPLWCTSGTLSASDLTSLRTQRDNPQHPLGPARVPAPASTAAVGVDLADQVFRGLADFMVKRAKEEAILAVQERIAKKVCKGDLQDFLTDTCELVGSLDAGLSLRAMGTSFHTAAIADLERVPDVALYYMGEKGDTKGNHGAYLAARWAYVLYREVRRGRSPVEVFGSLHELPKPVPGSKPEAVEVITIRRISAMAHVARGRSMQSVQAPTSDAESRALVLGLMLEAEVLAGSEFTLDEVNAGLGVAPRAWDFINHVNATQARLAKLKAPATNEDVAEMLLSLADAVELGAGILGKPASDSFVTTFREVAQTGGALVMQDWGAVASGVIHLLKERDELEAIAAVLPLIVEVANAESSKEVAVAIEAAAAPAGSYRSKYEHWTLSLNGFVGGGGGGEFVSSEGLQGLSTIATGFAPVGLHAAAPWASGKDGRKWMHIGGFVSLIDLGALTTYRVKTELQADEDAAAEGSTEQAPQIGLAQVFSPGAFLTIGVARLPLVIGGGVSMSPNLRRISEDGVFEERNATALRMMVFLAIDITLFQFR